VLIETVHRLRIEYIPKYAILVQKYYLRQLSFMVLHMLVQKFVERLNDLDHYLLYFPQEFPKQLNQNEIIEILDQAKARESGCYEAMNG
jgi:hypothetical protein